MGRLHAAAALLLLGLLFDCAGSAPSRAASPALLGSGAPASSASAGAALASASAADAATADAAPNGTEAQLSTEAVDGVAPSAARSMEADAGAQADTTGRDESSCNDQSPQDFLVRGVFLKDRSGNRNAIQYRTDHYGYFKGFGTPGPDSRPPSESSVRTSFMGLPVTMHRRVVPALACVEQEIKRACTEHRYVPHALAGIRFRNTYRGGEVTNHAYGIAIDVDPDLNTCCGCVKPWNDAPICKRPAKTEYDRMVMPECWVHAFERFGFYWLGHDVLRDTMHFEFLGDPDRILKNGKAAGP